jgi:hypothetical protein
LTTWPTFAAKARAKAGLSKSGARAGLAKAGARAGLAKSGARAGRPKVGPALRRLLVRGRRILNSRRCWSSRRLRLFRLHDNLEAVDCDRALDARLVWSWSVGLLGDGGGAGRKQGQGEECDSHDSNLPGVKGSAIPDALITPPTPTSHGQNHGFAAKT